MKAVMITMTGREESAADTIRQFGELGIEVEQFIQGVEKVAGPDSNRWNGTRALQACLDAGEDCLFVEDDLDLNIPRLRRALEAAEGLGEIMYLYLNEDEPRVSSWFRGEDLKVMKDITRVKNMRGKDFPEIISKMHIKEGPRQIAQPYHLYGTQCVFIPLKYLQDFIAFLSAFHTYTERIHKRNVDPVDGNLLRFIQKNQLRAFTYLPHPVQHRQVRIRRKGSRPNANSASFYLTSDLDVAHAEAEEKRAARRARRKKDVTDEPEPVDAGAAPVQDVDPGGGAGETGGPVDGPEAAGGGVEGEEGGSGRSPE